MIGRYNMKFTNWDRFKDSKKICKMAGCSKEEMFICCPDLDTSLCKPKGKILRQLNIKEELLDKDLVSVEEIISRLE